MSQGTSKRLERFGLFFCIDWSAAMITDKILYSTEAKIKDITALIVLEDGSTLKTLCARFGHFWWGNYIYIHVIYSDS